MTDFGLAIRNFVGPGEVPDIQGLYAYSERAEALGFESLVLLREPEADRSFLLNRGDGVKAKPTLRDVQNDAAIARPDRDIGKPYHLVPRCLAPFRRYGKCHRVES